MVNNIYLIYLTKLSPYLNHSIKFLNFLVADLIIHHFCANFIDYCNSFDIMYNSVAIVNQYYQIMYFLNLSLI